MGSRRALLDDQQHSIQGREKPFQRVFGGVDESYSSMMSKLQSEIVAMQLCRHVERCSRVWGGSVFTTGLMTSPSTRCNNSLPPGLAGYV